MQPQGSERVSFDFLVVSAAADPMARSKQWQYSLNFSMIRRLGFLRKIGGPMVYTSELYLTSVSPVDATLAKGKKTLLLSGVC